MAEEEIPQKTEEQLLRDEVMNDLNQAMSDFQEGKLRGLALQGRASEAWHKALKNKTLSGAVNEALRVKREALHRGFGTLDIGRHGDPVRKRYDPTFWIDSIPPEFKDKEEAFILDRIRSLREFFSGLSI